MSQQSLQRSTIPPAQPTYVLRGHAAQIHAVHFFKQNLRLISGDAEGWIVVWSVPIRRPVAVWRAHKGTILGVGTWGDERIITHGRDGKLNVWQMRFEDESTFSTVLPVDDAENERKQPWLLHSLTVNALNFCSFAMCKDIRTHDSVLLAMTGVQDGFINIVALPGEERIATVPSPKDVKTGMLMAVRLCYSKDKLTVIAGYESGHVVIWQQVPQSTHWQTTYVNKAHSQPVLSVACSELLGFFFSSSADAVVARHPLPGNEFPTKFIQTKHAGQQSLQVRPDDKIFGTAGWDGRIRVYSAKTCKELAVLKWHKEGCYALAFADTTEAPSQDESSDETTKLDHNGVLTVQKQREQKAMTTHWLAAGSKDGKISLWDIY